MSRPLLPRRDTKSDEAKQRREVLARDGYVCRFERVKIHGEDGSEEVKEIIPAFFIAGLYGWAECGRRATDTAHIVRRHQCGKARFDPAVALRACRRCHDAFDKHQGGVRVPSARMRRALAAINRMARVKIVA